MADTKRKERNEQDDIVDILMEIQSQTDIEALSEKEIEKMQNTTKDGSETQQVKTEEKKNKRKLPSTLMSNSKATGSSETDAELKKENLYTFKGTVINVDKEELVEKVLLWVIENRSQLNGQERKVEEKQETLKKENQEKQNISLITGQENGQEEKQEEKQEEEKQEEKQEIKQEEKQEEKQELQQNHTKADNTKFDKMEVDIISQPEQPPTEPTKEQKNVKAYNITGFDMEWKVTYEKGSTQRKTALIQICKGDRCALFHLFAMNNTLPKCLQKYLQDTSQVKVGLNIKGDAMKIHRDFGIKMSSFIDLGKLAQKALQQNLKFSLADLTMRFLGSYLSKDQNVRTGDWEQVPLSQEQIGYAAADASASYELYPLILQYYHKRTKSIMQLKNF